MLRWWSQWAKPPVALSVQAGLVPLPALLGLYRLRWLAGFTSLCAWLYGLLVSCKTVMLARGGPMRPADSMTCLSAFVLAPASLFLLLVRSAPSSSCSFYAINSLCNLLSQGRLIINLI